MLVEQGLIWQFCKESLQIYSYCSWNRSMKCKSSPSRERLYLFKYWPLPLEFVMLCAVNVICELISQGPAVLGKLLLQLAPSCRWPSSYERYYMVSQGGYECKCVKSYCRCTLTCDGGPMKC